MTARDYFKAVMDTLTIKIPRALNQLLREKAKKLGRSKSELAREWIENALQTSRQPTCHDLMKEACGMIKSGPKDASLKEGFEP